MGLINNPPELCELSSRALHCYRWCGGFNPALWPLYDTFYNVDDWQVLQSVMQELAKD